MSEWEREALAKCPCKPAFFFRFLDDIIGACTSKPQTHMPSYTKAITTPNIHSKASSNHKLSASTASHPNLNISNRQPRNSSKHSGPEATPNASYVPQKTNLWPLSLLLAHQILATHPRSVTVAGSHPLGRWPPVTFGIEHFKYTGLESNSKWSESQHQHKESVLIRKLDTISPHGLNEKP